MSILINNQTRVLIQGMTGKEGQRAVEWMKKSGTQVLAGVTPGKGGQEVKGVPVFDTVKEALSSFPEINTSSIYAPPRVAFSAVAEAIQAKIPLIHVIAEGIPTKDTAQLIQLARSTSTPNHQIRIVGPSSIGIISPGKGSLGSMGGGEMSQYISPGPDGGVAVLSKSGGMANTIASTLTYAGIPQSTVVGIGGDRFIGTTFADLISDLAADDESSAIVLIGEIGGSYEEVFAAELQNWRKNHGFSKRVIAFISGIFAETLPQGVAFGHAGAIVSKTEGTRQGKIQALQIAGVEIAHSPADIVELLKEDYA